MRTRFIPARAGNTTASITSLQYPAVHPRTCGEHTSSISLNLRGKLARASATKAIGRESHQPDSGQGYIYPIAE